MEKNEIKKRLFKELEILDKKNGVVYKCPKDMLTEAIENINDEEYKPSMLTKHLIIIRPGDSVSELIQELQPYSDGIIKRDDDDIVVEHSPIEETEEDVYYRLYNKLWNNLWPEVFWQYYTKQLK